ncbi:MAG: ligase-associated DNA damage response exonuclease [Cryomorphaceae bacterium]|nr:ligase-associated DNA damage response exonuclease [Flavobacteriales bacterium]
MSLITFTESGFYCEKADLYIDPWKPVKRALITHAHADHSRSGMNHYMAHLHSIPVMKHRLGDIDVQGVEYGETICVNGVNITFYPAGHVPGSAQIKLEHKSESWVIMGDYKLGSDGVSTPFEPVKCSHLVTESTFGLPIYNWEPQDEVMNTINKWWAENAASGVTSVMLGYAFGKAQRILANLDPSLGEIFVHGAIYHTNNALSEVGYKFPKTEYVTNETDKKRFRGAIILAPPSALGSTWIRKFKPFKVATASGWMALRGARRRRNVDKGFVLSDHADWTELNKAVTDSGAENIFVTHGYSNVFASWLKNKGLNAEVVKTAFEGELSEIGESTTAEPE